MYIFLVSCTVFIKGQLFIRMNKMADAIIVSNRSRDLWCESNKLRCSSNLMTCTIDGNNDSTSIADMFSDKYDTLYNSVPYDTNHIKLIEREIMSRVQKCNDESYNITVHVPDVVIGMLSLI